MALMKEFKTFALRGNVVDMAVGIIIGAAFGKIVSSLVKDVVTPPLGFLLQGMNFTQLFVNLGPVRYETLADAQDAGAPVLTYGIFLQNVLDFAIVALVIFLLIKGINSLRRKEEAPAEPPRLAEDILLLREIRDLLKDEK